jgi:SAM-dependent methyltransferase
VINYGGRHEFLRELHKTLRPKRYLEIGVQFGKSLQLAEIDCEIIGIDPNPMVGPALANAVYTMTSDAYFERFKPGHPHHNQVDFAFIDGSHLAEDALRDFINVQRIMAPGGVIALDDVLPYDPAIAGRVPLPGDWAGDVWRLRHALPYQPNLVFTLVDVDPTGLLVVQNLDPSSTTLDVHYDRLAETWQAATGDPVPSWACDRSGALQPDEALQRIATQFEHETKAQA